MSSPLVVPLVDEGMGNSAYLVDLGDGRALALDPSRGLRALHDAARKHGLTVATGEPSDWAKATGALLQADA